MTNNAPIAFEAPAALLGSYANSLNDGYDEVASLGSGPRPHWMGLLAALDGLGLEDLAARNNRLQRRVRETGIAYDIFSDPRAPSQTWQVDMAPVVISVSEWQAIEAGLRQRARVFDVLLADLYGGRDLMRRGVVPPELIFSDRTYLRPVQGLLPNAGPLRFYAADLARGSDGQWQVVDNHMETLAGIGFAVANRVVHTHVTSDIFKRCNAVRIASFFQNLQAALAAHAGRENARIALLTPGPHHPDYFSHSYLARYLGYLLVEGGDLRTKGNQVFLKTLEGLKPLDLIVRCCEGDMVDALELDAAGFSGPAGLLRVNRAEPGLVVNPVGTAVGQNRGLGAYLDAVSRDRLGEPLALKDVSRHWLGDARAREMVLQNLDRYYIRKAQEGTGRPGHSALGALAHNLSNIERDRLVHEIQLHGASLVAEERIEYSSAPSFNGETFVPQQFAMRCFVAYTGVGYEVMPGGLALSVDGENLKRRSTVEGHTRDVWVLSDDAPSIHVSLWRPRIETARVERSQRVIQSRVADDLYWLGRYNERADWAMRVLRGTFRRMEDGSGSDSGSDGGMTAARNALKVLLDETIDDRPLAGAASESEIERLSFTLISDPKNPQSLGRTFEYLYRCANLVRDRLSLEAWQTLSRFRPGDTFIRSLEDATATTALDLLEEGLASLAAFNGLMHENMTRNYGWSFIDMGRRLERAVNLASVVHALFVLPHGADEEMSRMQFILELADSFITYRSRYRLDPSLPLVLDLLLLDEANPRSLAYQLVAISRHLESLPDNQRGASLAEDRRLILSLLTSMRLANVELLAARSGRADLDALMTRNIDMLPELSDAIGRHYFNLADDAPHRAHVRNESPRGGPGK